MGLVITLTKSWETPSRSKVLRIRSVVAMMARFALGWGENTIAHPALSAIRDLKITVDVGLVDGIRPATTPTGTPISIRPLAGSSLIMPTVFKSRI